jgi:hypothetical protein
MKDEIVIYQSSEKLLRLEVRINEDSVGKESLLTATDGKKTKQNYTT